MHKGMPTNLVDDQLGAKLLADVDEGRQRREVAVHRVDRLHDDKDVACGRPPRAQDPAEVRHVVVPERLAAPAPRAHAVVDGRVHQLVVDDEVVAGGERREQAVVGVVARVEEERRLAGVERRQLPRARGQTHGEREDGKETGAG